MPNFYNMKATCGQRGPQATLSLSPSKHSSSVGNLVDGLRLQQQPVNGNGHGSSITALNDIVESGHYDSLKTGSNRSSTLQREKCISVTYKEQPQVRVEKISYANAAAAKLLPESAYLVGDVETRLRLTDSVVKSKEKKMQEKIEGTNENAAINRANSLRQSSINLAEEGSEEFVSRAASPDDDDARDVDVGSQAWDDDDEAVDDEDDMTDCDDDAQLDDDDDDVDEVGLQTGPSSERYSNSSARDGAARDASNADVSGGVISGIKKQLSATPLSRIRAAQQEQQRRLREVSGIDKSRPVTGCGVAFNGSAAQFSHSALKNRLAALPKRSVTRPPTAATKTSAYETRALNQQGELAPFHRRTTSKVGLASPDSKTLLPLHPSMFSNVPPTLVFAGEEHTVDLLPREVRILLRWRTSTITPNILKKILSRSNFKLTAKDEVWVGCWAKHMKQELFKAVREFQKFNHFPGSFQIGRKDRLWRNLSAMQAKFGRKEFNFFPQTYVLPGDYKLLKRVMEESEKRQRWILKPPASARGNGIRCVCTMKQVPKKRPVIVQKYIHQPYLINESKFDIRLYVYVTCYDPLKAYIFTDGLARFASTKYSTSLRDLPNKFMHLTNYSINKHNAEYQSNGDQDAQQGHKWSLHALWSHFSAPASEEEAAANGNTSRKPVDIDQLWGQIKDIAVKTLLAAEQHVVSSVKMNVVNRYAVHELFGFDILLDRELRPWLLEVNISPSLHSDSPLDCKVKGEMLKDLLNLAGYRLPSTDMLKTSASNESNETQPSENINSFVNNSSNQLRKSPHFDPRLVTSGLSVDERSKHSYYVQNCKNDQAMRTILDTITPDDLRILLEFEDERSRMGNFEAIFPTTQSRSYLRMMDPPRYYNLLIDAWLRAYGDDIDADGNPVNRHEKGLEFLDSMCRRGIHLESSTSDWRHIWRPPTLGPSSLSTVHRTSTSSATSTNPTPAPPSKNLASMHSHSTGSLPSQYSES